MNQQNVNIEIFNKFRFSSNSRGEIQCPETSCSLVIVPENEDGHLTNEQKQIIWGHVENAHEGLFEQLSKKYSEVIYEPRANKIDRAFDIVLTTNSKIIKTLQKLSTTLISEQEVIQIISAENKKMEQDLAELLAGFSSSTQQTTSSVTPYM